MWQDSRVILHGIPPKSSASSWTKKETCWWITGIIWARNSKNSLAKTSQKPMRNPRGWPMIWRQRTIDCQQPSHCALGGFTYPVTTWAALRIPWGIVKTRRGVVNLVVHRNSHSRGIGATFKLKQVFVRCVHSRATILDGRNRARIIGESFARVIVAIRIANVRWRSYLSPKQRN